MYAAYVYQTNSELCIIAPCDASVEVYAAYMPAFLGEHSFNLARRESRKTLDELREVARKAGVELHGKRRAYVHDHTRIESITD